MKYIMNVIERPLRIYWKMYFLLVWIFYSERFTTSLGLEELCSTYKIRFGAHGNENLGVFKLQKERTIKFL